MKSLILPLTAFLVVVCTATTTTTVTNDFMSGFESGIMMRNNEQGLSEYGCPEPHAEGFNMQ